ncbi:hypothetical protein BCU12_07370 [Vibrio sp. 10N.261.55.A7]|nr:hypothetical protein BCU12_07370 [Vibrio sp. 10N.261.55.A7]
MINILIYAAGITFVVICCYIAVLKYIEVPIYDDGFKKILALAGKVFVAITLFGIFYSRSV